MRKKTTGLVIAMTGIISLALLAGCGREAADGRGTGDGGQDKVTIALWSDQLTEHYGAYLRDQFPDVEFEFYVATNSTDFYRFKEEQGDLPDILTVRRFALSDVAPWKDSLLDVSGSELANAFPQTYLRSYTYEDGTVNWLPACAEVDSTIINKTLLEENGIALPSDYGEFVDVCVRLKGLGIRPYESNFEADYTCMEILQGLSAAQLTSQAGRQWRQLYESGQTDQLSEEVWLPVFQRMEEFIDYAGITAENLELGNQDVYQHYEENETAMIRGTSDIAVRYSVDKESVMMPYYGETQEENWYLTYPAFQAAANVKAQEDPEREKLILDIMTAMLDEDGLLHIADGQNMIAYNRNVTLPLSPELAHLQSAADDNRLYIRLASADMFAISKQVVQGMIRGEYADARAAFDAFNEAMKTDGKEEDDTVAAHIDRDYDYAFSPDGGNKAASAVVNSLRESMGTQIFIGQASNIAGNIRSGDYTLAQLGFLTQGEGLDILLCDMTGEQLYQFMEYMLTTPDKRGSVVNDSTLYVSAGFEMEISRTDAGYELERLSVSGHELDRKEVFTAAVLGSEELMLRDALAAAGIPDYVRTDASFKQLIVDRLAKEGKQLAEPTDYIVLR